MTSIISPALYATQLATRAQQSLKTASDFVDGTLEVPVPLHDGLVGIPEQHGPNTPDNPWYVGPGRPNPALPIRTPFQFAASHARDAIQAIDSALALGANDSLARNVLSAFASARQQAEAGLRELTSPTMNALDTKHVVLQFDGASLWLGLAKNLIHLQNGPVVRPPVTTLPVEPTEPVAPGEPGSPITIKPIDEPITIQLPSPDSEIQ
jgi:hypothetical protein